MTAGITVPLKILRVVRYPDRVALEYEVVEPVDAQGYQPHHPQTFPALASDDRCTWENLRLGCDAGHDTDEDCIFLARAMLEREVKEDAAGVEGGEEMVTLLNEGFE